MTIKFTPADAGCYIGDHNGWRVSGHVVELALDLRGTEFLKGRNRRETRHNRWVVRKILAAYFAGEDTVEIVHRSRWNQRWTETVENLGELIGGQGGYADDATDYLNTLAPEGYSWGFWEGGFYLDSTEWWEEV